MRATASIVLLLSPHQRFAQFQAALTRDHLHCVKVKDSVAKKKYDAYDASIYTILRIENGCEVKLPAALLCTPAISYDERPSPPNDIVGVPPSGPVVCYKATCPKTKAPLPRATFVDQFGSHAVARGLADRRSPFRQPNTRCVLSATAQPTRCSQRLAQHL